MDKIDKLIFKYFDDSCTADEARQVLEWFDTPEGQAFLKKNLNADIERIDEELVRYMVPGLDSGKLLNSIRKKIRVGRYTPPDKKQDSLKSWLKVAATVLVIVTASLFAYSSWQTDTGDMEEPTPAHYATADDQQREITLSDGSTIRLNSNSEVWITHDYSGEKREVQLSGEAYFDVVHDSGRPFFIYTNGATVEVLGTAFNVKALPSGRDVQLAVMDGRVSFASADDSAENPAVVLKQGQFGYMDLEKHTIDIEEFGVENYTNWIKGRLVFDQLTLDRVCLQLDRFYDLQCSYSDASLRKLTLTADFSNDSLEKTLSVISLSLGIQFEKSGNQVVWK